MSQKEHLIPQSAAGKRLDVALLELLGSGFSRAQVQRLLKQGHILVAGSKARPSQKAEAGARIRVALPPPEPLELEPQAMDLDILYEDAHLLVLNKAPGLVVHPAPGHSGGTLVHGLLHHCGKLTEVGGKNRPGIVHRLDKDTSGAMVVAKSDRAQRGLVTAFAAGRVKKEYLALVWGRPPLKGENTKGIGRHPVDRKRMSTKSRQPKPAHTAWRVVRRFGDEFSLLRVRIRTGRTHQIRVHLGELGYPVLGDMVYGGRRARKKLPDPLGLAVESAGRQLLHAVDLSFNHPVTREPVSFTAPLHKDYRQVLSALLSD
jgi:23S rRNA pseudouridine1911/1915/1917 synthase